MLKLTLVILGILLIVATVIIGILLSRKRFPVSPPKNYKAEADTAIKLAKNKYKVQVQKIKREADSMKQKIDATKNIDDEMERLQALADLVNSGEI